MVSAIDLTTPATSFPRQKYFPVELYCTGCLPNTTYDCYVDGALYNAYCKPFGGQMGAALTAGANGKLIIQMHIRVNYAQQYLVKPTLPNNNIVTKTHTITLVDPFNNSSTQSLSILCKSGSL